METAHAISVEEYLRTSYEYSPELIDGQIRDRPMPTPLHGFTVAMISFWFSMHMDEWRILALLGVTTQVAASNFRVPEVSVIPHRPIRNEIQKEPPFIAIEVLDDDDKFRDLRDRATDLSRMGVEHVWLVDPERREAFTWESRERFWRPSKQLQMKGSLIHLDLDWLWKKMSQE